MWKVNTELILDKCNICIPAGKINMCTITKTVEQVSANIYLFKVNNRNSRKRCNICSKLTIKTPERRH